MRCLRQKLISAFILSSVVLICLRTLRQTSIANTAEDAPVRTRPLDKLDKHQDKPAIPKLLHQTFAHSRVFKRYKPFIESCLQLNPDWKYILWTDQEIKTLIENRYPKLRETFKLIKNKLEISDISRVLALHAFGGIYLDMDVECRAPLWPAIGNHSAFVSEEPKLQAQILHNFEFLATNAVMGSVPGHPFFGQVISLFEQKAPQSFGNVLETTGPLAITREMAKYWRDPQNQSHPVTLLPSHAFMPLMDEHEAKKWPSLCANPPDRSPRSRGCEQAMLGNWSVPRNFQPETIGIHHWVHLTVYGQSQERFDILDQFKGRIHAFNGGDVQQM